MASATLNRNEFKAININLTDCVTNSWPQNHSLYDWRSVQCHATTQTTAHILLLLISVYTVQYSLFSSVHYANLTEILPLFSLLFDFNGVVFVLLRLGLRLISQMGRIRWINHSTIIYTSWRKKSRHVLALWVLLFNLRTYLLSFNLVTYNIIL